MVIKMNIIIHYFKKKGKFEELTQKRDDKLKPSIEEAPKLELKNFLGHLEYVYLPNNSKLLVIITSDLSAKQNGIIV